MRKIIRKNFPIPEALHDNKVQNAKEALRKFYQLNIEDRSRQRPPINHKIWASKSIKYALQTVFHSKCAYCESPIDNYSLSTLDHYRPIHVSIKTNTSKVDNYYSWFAYEWENFFLSCPECNQLKSNWFPLKGPSALFQCTWKEAEETEQTLLMNPCRSEPQKHLKFQLNGEVTGLDVIGQTTIDLLSLNRSTLVWLRIHKFQKCLGLLELGHYGDSRCLEEFQNELKDEAPFSGATRIAFFHLISSFTKNNNSSTKPSFENISNDTLHLVKTINQSQWRQFIDLANTRTTDLGSSPLNNLNTIKIKRLPSYSTPRASKLIGIEIRNFKGISKLDLKIPSTIPGGKNASCMMLLGENSTGKSTTLQAIALTLMGQKMRTSIRVSPEDFIPREVLNWRVDDTKNPQVTLNFDTGEPITLSINSLTKEFTGDEQTNIVLFAFGSRRFFGEKKSGAQYISNIKSLFDPFVKLQHPEPWIQKLNDKDFNALARAMREILTLQDEDSIGRDEEQRLFVRAHGRNTPLEQLSDGYRSLMAMVLVIMKGMLKQWGDLESACGIVLIDEIETHLHPRWKLRVVSSLRQAMPNVQFIATTHDPLCLRGMYKEEVKVLVRDHNQQIEALRGLPDVRGLRAEQLLTSDYFGLSSTADPLVEHSLNSLALPDDSHISTENHLQDSWPFQLLGNTPFEQIMNEALNRFTKEAATTAINDRAQVREAAINDILQRLRALRLEHHS